MPGIIKQIKAAERFLRKAAAAPHAPLNENGMWLTDNERLLSLSLKNGRLLLKEQANEHIRAAFETLCRLLTDQTEVLNENTLTKLLSGVCDSVSLFAFLPTLLYCALSLTAVHSFTLDPEDDKTAVMIRSIFALQKTDMTKLWVKISPTEQMLCKDPAGFYEKSDERTKLMYRERLFALSQKQKTDELETAKKLYEQAFAAPKGYDHIGFYLFDGKIKNTDGTVILLLTALFAVILTGMLSAFAGQLIHINELGLSFLYLPFALLLFPGCFAVSKPLFRMLSARLFPPKPLPRLSEEIEKNELPKVLLTVSDILPKAKNAPELEKHFESLFALTDGLNRTVIGLFDYKSADKAVLPTDEADLTAVKQAFDRLNQKHGGGFVMALRERTYKKGENEYSGLYRKRGAVNTLVRLLTEHTNGFSVLYGDTSGLEEAKYLFLLDSDTQPGFDCVQKMLLTACHPLNKAQTDTMTGKVLKGYGCFAPAAQTQLSSSLKTLFSRIQTVGGSTCYTPAVSEQYMDLFGTSLFTGKGLIDISVYKQTVLNGLSSEMLLSHDIPEGALTRTAFVNDAFISESFPSSVASYYKRQERWARGDIQNLVFLWNSGFQKNNRGSLPPLAKWQLSDNILRCLTPIAGVISVIFSFFLPQKASLLFLLAGIIPQIADILPYFLRTVFCNGLPPFTRVGFGLLFNDSTRDMLRMLLSVGLLPEEGLVYGIAVAKALYRMFISKKKLLEWTTASQGEGKKGNIFVFGVFPVLYSVLLFFNGVPGRLLAFLTLLCVPFALSNGIVSKTAPKQTPNENETEFLYNAAASMWQFFADTVTPEEHFLPPDHIRLSPVKKTERKTSPTNLGLYLLSAVCAADLSLISAGELYERLDRTLTTVEGLTKYKGLLYNWYSTAAAAPISPLYISTVDCGNFLTCLVTLKEALKEYIPLVSAFQELIKRIEALIKNSDLGCLYDKNRKLFYVGLDLRQNQPSDSYYDLYYSESLLTSYYAVASKTVAGSHFSSLNRLIVLNGGYITGTSWTGTAFEYFMPTLFLPTPENTLTHETLKAVFQTQKLRFASRYPVFGVSESQYYAMDESFGFLYKAHGVKGLALKRHADEEPVFAPYASFLFMSTELHAAIKNLRRFSSLNAYGKYGFYEAVDFTADRLSGQDYMPVKSYMSHHVGMSMVAVLNALNDNIFVKRFLRDEKMQTAVGLLTEKIPTGKTERLTDIKNSGFSEPKKTEKTKQAAAAKNAAVYSSGASSVIVSKNGKNLWLADDIFVLSNQNNCGSGLFAGVFSNGVLFPLYGNGEKSEPQKNRYFNEVKRDGLLCRASLSLLSDLPVCVSPLYVKNTGTTEQTVSLLWYFEPLLQKITGHMTNRFYSDLMIKTDYDADQQVLYFTNHSKSVQKCIAAGFSDESDLLFQTNREKILPRTVYQRFPFEKHRPDFNGETATVSPAAAIKKTFRLKPGQKKEAVLLLSLGENREEALNGLRAVRAVSPDTYLSRAAKNPFLQSASLQELCERFITDVFFENRTGVPILANEKQNGLSVSALYPYGVSGDLPILTVITDDLPARYVKDAVILHETLSFCHIQNDLVLFSHIPSDYRSEPLSSICDSIPLSRLKAETNRSGGIHLIRSSAGTYELKSLLTALPGIMIPPREKAEPDRAFFDETNILPCKPGITGKNAFVPGGYFVNQKINRPMSHTLSNSVFGTLLTDSSLGYTWGFSSLLNPLTSRQHGICDDFSGERLFFGVFGELYEPVKEASVFFYPEKAVYTATANGIGLQISVLVHKKAAVKQIRVKVNAPQNTEWRLYLRLTPVMSEKESEKRLVRYQTKENGFVFHNPARTDFAGYFGVFCENALLTADGGFTVNREGKGNGEVLFTYVFSRSEKGVIPLKALPFHEITEPKLSFNGLSEELRRFGETLLYHSVKDSRFFARTGFYQCSGAYGYRDQLQDMLALLPTDPLTVKRHIFRCAAAQFFEGDVLHWFHIFPFDKNRLHGVRTRCSDDMLWLPFAVSRYIEATGDHSILTVVLPFLEGEPLSCTEKERYTAYAYSQKTADLYTHCIKAIEKAATSGAHGLPLMGSCDWNDSFSEVGSMGKGESVWLAMFLRLTAERFLPYCRKREDIKTIAFLTELSQKLSTAVMTAGFNGTYFIRGYYDDGTPLGDMGQSSCKIDLLAQAFAVFADIGTPEIRKKALKTALSLLLDEKARAIKLFTPPFTPNTKPTGYVNSYQPGVRENGGQYTHAAIWFILALAKEGLTEEAKQLALYICPSELADRDQNRVYQSEPYALCSDVYCAEGLAGKGGWSLYTGASGWYLQLLRLLNGG